jgi:hypothetical protein
MPSPPLPTVALAPPPSNLTLSERRAQRQRQRATLPSPMPSTPASLLFHSTVPDPRSMSSQATARHSVLDPPLSSVSSGDTDSSGSADTHHLSQEDDTASVMSAASSSLSHPTGGRTLSPVARPHPRLRSPLPPHYRYPSPAPSLASSVSTATSASITSTSTSTSISSASTSASGQSKDDNSVGHHRRKTITAADDPVLVIGRSDSATTVTPALLNPAPTHSTNTLSRDMNRGRGRSFSRSVRKVASVFNLLKKEDVVSIPSVPELPTLYQSVSARSITQRLMDPSNLVLESSSIWFHRHGLFHRLSSSPPVRLRILTPLPERRYRNKHSPHTLDYTRTVPSFQIRHLEELIALNHHYCYHQPSILRRPYFPNFLQTHILCIRRFAPYPVQNAYAFKRSSLGYELTSYAYDMGHHMLAFPRFPAAAA